MLQDQQLILSNAQAVTTTANSTTIYDVTGAGSGNAPAMVGADGLATKIGIDVGAGDGVATVYGVVIFSAVGASGNTITVSLQAAPDNGSYSPGTYVTLYSSAALTESALSAGYTLTFQVPPMLSTSTQAPRFYRFVYTCSGAVTCTITAELLLNAPMGTEVDKFGSNYKVAQL